MQKVKRFDYVDGMKGLAALSVFSWHFALYTGAIYYPVDTLTSHSLTGFLIDGCVAVCVFILLSGFSNAYSLSLKPLTIKTIRDTLVKRYLRLAVPIAPIILIVAIMRWLGLMYNYEFAEFSGVQIATSYYNQSTYPSLFLRLLKALVCSPIGDVSGLDLPLWMMKYVFIGAYFVMMMHIITHKMRIRYRLLIIGFATFLIGYLISLYYVPALVGLALLYVFPFLNKGSHILSVLSLALTAITYLFFPNIMFPMKGVLTAIFLVVGVISSPVLKTILGCRFLKWLGSISLMVYLIHMPLICSFSYSLLMKIPFADSALLNVTVYIITLIILLILSHFFTIWIEKKISPKAINNIMAKLPEV